MSYYHADSHTEASFPGCSSTRDDISRCHIAAADIGRDRSRSRMSCGIIISSRVDVTIVRGTFFSEFHDDFIAIVSQRYFIGPTLADDSMSRNRAFGKIILAKTAIDINTRRCTRSKKIDARIVHGRVHTDDLQGSHDN